MWTVALCSPEKGLKAQVWFVENPEADSSWQFQAVNCKQEEGRRSLYWDSQETPFLPGKEESGNIFLHLKRAKPKASILPPETSRTRPVLSHNTPMAHQATE